MPDDKHPITIAIDGYSSSGKSTMAKRLARAIGYRYIDTGAMYRAVTLYALDHGLIKRPDAIVAALPNISITFDVRPDGQHTLLNGQDVEKEIRGTRVSDAVSVIAAIPEVRRAMVKRQQKMGEGGGVILDGRDIGTVVFPNAGLKIFVDASAETRAQRRYDEYRAKGVACNYEEVLANVHWRDRMDSTRAEGPLRCAPDALRLDNSQMTLDEQDAWLLRQYRRAVGQDC